MSRRLFNISAVFSALLLIISLAVWPLSYIPPLIVADPLTGFSPGAPPHPFVLPMPSDAEEYVVALHGNIERWEYADWENKWYRVGNLASIPALVAVFAIAPLIWLLNRTKSHRRES